MKLKLRLICTVPVLLLSTAVCAQEDMPGSQDHPDVPRIEGTYIVGYGYSAYDEGEFITGMEDRKLQTVFAEGKRTRIAYLGPKTISPLLALRNYQSALAELGEVVEIFSCRKNDCYSNLPDTFTWSSQRRVNNVMPTSNYVFANDGYYRDQLYWYGTVTSATTRYHVSIYSSVFSENNQVREVRGFPSVHLEVLEEADFEPTLEVVTPETIAESISETGHIALYGIQFDFDSDTLKSNSAPTLEQIAKALTATHGLMLYVVGHSDNEGTLQYNQDLSTRRAESVVTKLTSHHGIESSRLVALGVGPAAPLASNDSEDGRALNRRVELVKQ